MRSFKLSGLAVLFQGMLAIAALAHDARPLGDGRISSAPKSHHLFSCQQRFDPNAPGARRAGDWIRGRKYYPARKPVVSGNVTWPNARIEITSEYGKRVVRANNLPTHPTGRFPIRRSDPAYRYDRNPNSIREQNILLQLPLMPSIASRPSCVPMGMIGFTLTGAALYNPLDARGRDAPAYEMVDACGGHPQQQGQYHYHNNSKCLPKRTDKNGHSVLVGYALDGFGIFGSRDVKGKALANKHLDACHGHVGPVMWNGKIQRIYHYHVNDEYPYSIGCYRGEPLRVAPQGGRFDPMPGATRQGPGQPPRHHRPGGRDPVTAIARELNLDPDALRRAVGPPPPDIENAARMLGVDLRRLRAAFRRHRPR